MVRNTHNPNWTVIVAGGIAARAAHPNSLSITVVWGQRAKQCQKYFHPRGKSFAKNHSY
jgi:hypothetical protein